MSREKSIASVGGMAIFASKLTNNWNITVIKILTIPLLVTSITAIATATATMISATSLIVIGGGGISGRAWIRIAGVNGGVGGHH